MVEDLASLTDEQFTQRLAAALKFARDERQENQLRHYVAFTPTIAQIWECDAQTMWIGGGNRAGKTAQMLALVVACATGIFPDSLKHVAQRRFRGPIRIRVLCDSLTTTLYPMILPKLQWTKWNGNNPQGGDQGHWGWVPPYCLKDRSWDRSWNDKLRILTMVCRDPDNPEIVLGESSMHFMSYDQEEGRGQDYHIILHDEPPPLHIFRESQARIMGVGGRNLGAMTWPDDPSIPVDWIFDEIYEPGMAGTNPQIAWINIFATDNPHVDRKAIEEQAKSWSEETRRVRIYGQPIRFSNRVHPLFTDQTMHWCHKCGKTTFAQENTLSTGHYDKLLCATCVSTDVVEFNHVKEFDFESWPCIWLLDMHPRKPHIGLWVMVDPSDDLWVTEEMSEEGDPTDVKRKCDEIEERYGFNVALRLCDPNMGMQSASSKRNTTWQGAFDEAGLSCQLADDSSVGRSTVNQYLKPDHRRGQPRLHVHPRCKATIHSIKRYVWDDFKRAAEKDQKQAPKTKNDDQANLLKYLMNWNPSFSSLKGLGEVFRRPGMHTRGR